LGLLEHALSVQKLHQAKGFQTADNGETGSPDIDEFNDCISSALFLFGNFMETFFFPNPAVV